MLSGHNLSVERGDRRVLEDVDVCIRPGEVLAVVGPNGAGKSTMLAALTGRARLEGGAVLLDDDPLGGLRRQEIARRVSVMPQQFRSTFPFRAFEIVAMGRAPHDGFESAATRARIVETALAFADVLHLADRRSDRLSGGERQRVYLARALAQIMPLPAESPRYLLLDEPTASLDLRHQAAALGFARDAARDGVGVLAVLHDLNLAARFADQAIILCDGVVAAAGRPADIFTERVLGPIYGPDLAIFEAPSGGPVVLPRAPQAAEEINRSRPDRRPAVAVPGGPI